jgi:hypothetical protein
VSVRDYVKEFEEIESDMVLTTGLYDDLVGAPVRISTALHAPGASPLGLSMVDWTRETILRSVS